MASLQFRNGVYRLLFRFNGKQHSRVRDLFPVYSSEDEAPAKLAD